MTSNNAKTRTIPAAGKVVGGDGGKAIARYSENRTPPTDFSNIGQVLDAVPNPSGNPFAGTSSAWCDRGQSLIRTMVDLGFVETPAADVEGYRGDGVALEVLTRSAEMNAGRIISGLAGSFGYAHAYLDAAHARLAEMQTKLANVEGDRDREGIYGLVTASERGVVQVQAREADLFHLGCLINGAVTEFESVFGPYKLPARRDPGNSARSQEQVSTLAARMAAVLARKAG